MGVCRNCHREKARHVLRRHQKTCIPTERDMVNYSTSTGGGAQEYKRKQHAASKDEKSKTKTKTGV